MNILMIDAEREGYAPEQVRRTMTVGELIAFLSDYPEEMPVYIGNDRRYTYGGVLEDRITEVDLDEENE